MEKEFLRHYGVLNSEASGWQTEANEVGWNREEPKLDVRKWSPDYERCSKGVTMDTEQALVALCWTAQFLLERLEPCSLTPILELLVVCAEEALHD